MRSLFKMYLRQVHLPIHYRELYHSSNEICLSSLFLGWCQVVNHRLRCVIDGRPEYSIQFSRYIPYLRLYTQTNQKAVPIGPNVHPLSPYREANSYIPYAFGIDAIAAKYLSHKCSEAIWNTYSERFNPGFRTWTCISTKQFSLHKNPRLNATLCPSLGNTCGEYFL